MLPAGISAPIAMLREALSAKVSKVAPTVIEPARRVLCLEVLRNFRVKWGETKPTKPTKPEMQTPKAVSKVQSKIKITRSRRGEKPKERVRASPRPKASK